jgi:Tol biopolymer transport system component
VEEPSSYAEGPPGRGFAFYDCSTAEPVVYFVESDAVEPPKQPDLVLRIDAEGGTPKEVFRTSTGERLSSVALSPDGTRLSMISRLDRVRRAVLVMPSGGGAPQQLFEFRQPSGAWPSHGWSPDGRFIQVVDGPEDGKYYVREIRADGKGTGAETTYQRNQQFFGLTYHPSGRLVAFTARNQPSAASEVWVMENLREEMKLLAAPGKRP